jgi:HlyD family secretion protein
MAASEPLFRIIADGAVELQADVAEVELPSLTIGQQVAVTPAGAKEALAGTIRLIAPEVDKASRLGRVRVALDGSPSVAIGSFAKGVIETGRKSAVTLPLSAITYIRGAATAQVVKDGKVETRKVTLGLMGGGRVEIASGIAEGETAVARAGTFVRDGDVVTPVPTN